MGGRGVSGRLLLGTQLTHFTSTQVQMLTQKRLLVLGRGSFVEAGVGAVGLAEVAACLETAEVGVRFALVRRRQV